MSMTAKRCFATIATWRIITTDPDFTLGPHGGLERKQERNSNQKGERTMKFVLEIRCDNDAFAANPATEVARMLGSEIFESVERGAHMGEHVKIRDINGNNVGFWKFTRN